MSAAVTRCLCCLSPAARRQKKAKILPAPHPHPPQPPFCQGAFWSGSADREYAEFAWYYNLPTLSVKACCHHAMAAGARGFEARAPREGAGGALKGRAFYYDFIHPDGNTGHRCV